MTLPLFTVGGLASGLDTNGIVRQLIAVERVPLNQLTSRRAGVEAKDQAWQRVATRLQAAQEKLATLRDPAAWAKLSTATSSAPQAVAAAVTGSAGEASATFLVDRLAAAHQVAAAGTFASTTALVGAGTFTVTVGGTDHTVVTDGTATLADLVAEIDSLDVGVDAGILGTGTGEYRLFMRATSSGSDAAFTVSATHASLGAMSVVEQGVDARLIIGSGPGAITVERASNTVSDLVPGVTLTLSATTTAPVTVTVARDLDAAVDAIKGAVGELNSTLSLLTDLTRSGENGAGPLAGDAAARSLVLQIRGLLSSRVSGVGSTYPTAASAGVSLTRTGTLTVDDAKLRQALEADFEAVADLFSGVGATSTDGRVAYASSTSSTAPGSYLVNVTTAAGRASVIGTAYLPPAVPETFQITSGEAVATVTLDPGDDLAAAVSKITAALAAASITTVSVSGSDGAVALAESRTGTAAAFTVSANNLGLAGTHAGIDVAGTIGGETATGAGSVLTGSAGSPRGLSLTITATAAEVAGAGGTLAVGTVTFGRGLLGRVASFLQAAVEVDGTVSRARARWQSQVDLLDDRIEALEERLARREVALTRQFTALETAISRMSSLSAALTAQLSSLNQGS